MSIAEEDKNLPLENRWKLLWGKLLELLLVLVGIYSMRKGGIFVANIWIPTVITYTRSHCACRVITVQSEN